MGFLKHLGIRIQVLLLVLLPLASFMLLAAVYYYGEKAQNSLHEVAAHETKGVEYVKDLKIGFLQERRHEKDFLLRRSAKDTDEHKKVAQESMPYFDKLKTIHQEPDEQKMIDEMRAGFAAYVAKFQELVGIWNRIGLTPDEGLQGKLRGAVHAVEEELKKNNKPLLLNTMLQMRRHEKDFMLRIDPKFIDEQDKRKAEFLARLQDAGLAARLELITRQSGRREWG